MMEQNESVDFKTLRARFQGEHLKIPTKPVVPDKPIRVPPPPTKVNNPMISSLNTAIKKGTIHAPRVVFKDDKNLNSQLSPPPGLKGNVQRPFNNSELLDKNQKREGDIIKKAMKDRNLPLVLPVAPIKPKAPEFETSPLTPVSASPAKVSTPKSFVFNNTKPGRDVKWDNTENFTSAEPSPLTPMSASPAKVSTPKSFVFNNTKPAKDVKWNNMENVTSAEPSPLTPLSGSPARVFAPRSFVFSPSNVNTDVKADTVKSPIPALRTADHSALTPLTPVNQSTTAIAPSETIPVIPKALVPSRISAGEPSVPSISALSIPPSPSPEPKIPEAAIPKPAIRVQSLHKPEISQTETLPAKPNIHLLSLSEVFPPPEEDFTDIPPPVIPEDFMNSDFSHQTTPSLSVPASISPVSRSPAVSRTSSPSPPSRSAISPELLLSRPNVLTAPSSPPKVHNLATPKSLDLGSAKALTDKNDQSPIKSPLSFLARAEEMSPVKRTSPLDKRVFELLEKAKRQTKISNPTTTPDNATPSDMDAPKVALPNIDSPNMPQLNLPSTGKVLPHIPKPEVSLPEEAFNVPEEFDIKGLPPVDYSDHAPINNPLETTQHNGLDHSQTLPGVLTLVKQVNPPPTPPRKPPSVTPMVESPYEKSKPLAKHPQVPMMESPYEKSKPFAKHPQVPMMESPYEKSKPFAKHPQVPMVESPYEKSKPFAKHPQVPMMESPYEKSKPLAKHPQVPSIPDQHLEEYGEQPYDNSFEEPSFEDAEVFDPPAVPNFKPVPPLASGSVRPISAHSEALSEHLTPKHPTAGDVLPNMDRKDYGEVDYKSASSPQPDIQMRNSPVSRDVSPPSGNNDYSDYIYEDLVANKKGKTPKNKKLKGPPKNPYAESVAEETPKKGLFTRKNSEKVVEDKELKKKEKQREKEKEKEKERERKEQKEREKKENEIKKKFKITGQEEAMYQVKVIQDCKGRKNDLPVKVGETVSIIRTTSCPKGKWLGKDINNRYGYVPVESMDLNIDGIMELGKMTSATSRPNGNGVRDGEHTSTDSRTSDHYAMNHESFSDDSEEWTYDDEDTAYGSSGQMAHLGLNQRMATPTRGSDLGPVHQAQPDGNYSDVQAKHEALQKLSTFFTQPKTPSQPLQINNTPVMKMPRAVNPVNLIEEVDDQDIPHFQVLPPPDLYADLSASDSEPIYSKALKTIRK
ncbi:uncharacterized protein [Paramisgurnus dabryanus]|uniref:uncharacterized protein n=1 Tax=Paramisgurnus dabryanus TaxID=90735 RepID=UPI0031F3A51C